MLKAALGVNSIRIRCKNETGFQKRVSHTIDRLCRAQEPLDPGLLFLLCIRLQYQIYFSVRERSAESVSSGFAEHQDPRSEPAWTTALLKKKWVFLLPSPARSDFCLHAAESGCRSSQGSRELRIATVVVSAYFSRYFFRVSLLNRRSRDILWTIAASKITVFIFPSVLSSAYYEVHMHSRVANLHLYLSLDEVPCGELGRPYRLSLSLLGSTRWLEIYYDVSGCCSSAGSVEKRLHVGS